MSSKTLLFLLLLAVVAGASSGCDSANAEKTQYLMHYVQVPRNMPDGAPVDPAAIERFEEYLTQLSGGYTKLGDTSGGMLDAQGGVQRGSHISYLVGANSDEREQLAEYVRTNFGYDPYVFAWAVKY